MSSPIDFTSILYQAVQSPTGLLLKTNNAEALKQRLYQTRAKLKESVGDLFKGLKFRTSPTDPIHELWIVNTTPKEPTP